MDFKAHLETAWQNSLKFIVPAVLLTLVQIVVIMFSLGILAPVTTAGYMRSLLLALRDGREPEIKDLFSEMRLFLPLLVFGILAMLATVIGFLLIIVPGFIVIGFLVFSSLYMIPLMTDKDMGLIDALKESWQMATRQPVTDQIVVILVYLLVMALGGSIAIAILFAQPFATFFILSVYEERLKGNQEYIEEEDTTPPPPPAGA